MPIISQVLYYSNDVFLLAGVKHADIATVVVVGLTLVTFTIVTVSTYIIIILYQYDIVSFFVTYSPPCTHVHV